MVAHNVNVLDATDLHVQNDLNGKSHVCFATIFKKIKGGTDCARGRQQTHEKNCSLLRIELTSLLPSLLWTSGVCWSGFKVKAAERERQFCAGFQPALYHLRSWGRGSCRQPLCHSVSLCSLWVSLSMECLSGCDFPWLLCESIVREVPMILSLWGRHKKAM